MRKTILFQVLPFLLLTVLVNAGQLSKVVEVVDGDTVKVEIAGKMETVRLIGVDTPETHHPTKQVEYFGREASAFTEKHLLGKSVRLEADGQSANRDRYGRLLRYVFLQGVDFNAKQIREGYAHAYTKYPFDKLEEYRQLERDAREKTRGLWAPLPGKAQGAVKEKPKASATPKVTVYRTKTGKCYHRAGCRCLKKSKFPISLSEAKAKGLKPCRTCKPPK